MFSECCTSSGNIMLLPCSGGSNVGQLANQAAVELTQEGFGLLEKQINVPDGFDLEPSEGAFFKPIWVTILCFRGWSILNNTARIVNQRTNRGLS